MVRLPPASDSAPKVTAAATSARASGSRRSRVRKTRASVAAITSSAATSSTKIALCTASDSAPGHHRHPAHHVVGAVARLEDARLRGLPDEVDGARGFGRAQPGPHPHLDQSRVGTREEVPHPGLGHAGLGVVEYHRRHEPCVGEAGGPADAVAQGQPGGVHLKLRGHGLARPPGQAVLLGRWVAASGRQLSRRPVGTLRPRLERAQLPADLIADRAHGGVDERSRPVHGLRRPQPRQVAAHRGKPALAVLPVLGDRLVQLRLGHVAGEAALQPDQAQQVVGEDGVGELPLDQHHHGVVAEVLLEALGVPEGVRRAAHQRVGGRARLAGAARELRRRGREPGSPPAREAAGAQPRARSGRRRCRSRSQLRERDDMVRCSPGQRPGCAPPDSLPPTAAAAGAGTRPGRRSCAGRAATGRRTEAPPRCSPCRRRCSSSGGR